MELNSAGLRPDSTARATIASALGEGGKKARWANSRPEQNAAAEDGRFDLTGLI
jgi:hypothetical protein